MDNLPEQIVNRINGDAEKWAEVKSPLRIRDYSAHTKRVYNAYKGGATSEATRAMILLSFAEQIRDGYDHDTDAHKYNNLSACRVCAAEKAIASYNNQPSK